MMSHGARRHGERRARGDAERTINRTVARQLEQIFVDDLARSTRLDYRGWRARGMLDRTLELLAFPIRNLL
jgi:hypothetical protein